MAEKTYKLENRFLSVKSSFNDKETGELIEYTSKYKLADGVKEDTLTELLDQWNPQFMNKNIQDNLLPQGIVIETGTKKLIGELMAQMA